LFEEEGKHDEKLLVLEKISKRYGGVQALSNIDFQLNNSEVVGLLGDNGAGKSTLVKVISGAIKHDEGKIFFRGKEFLNSNPGKARDLGIETIYQDFALANKADIMNNMFLGRLPKKMALGLLPIIDKKKMIKESERVLNSFSINMPPVRMIVSKLSGGQRQAVAIARAIYFDPKILIMDEPLSGIATKQASIVLQMIVDFKRQGKSVILISHAIESVFSVADRLVVLKGGRVVLDKPTAKVNMDEVVKSMFGI
jgi:ABC-type sugar transport system ATPase subunit